MTNEQKQALVEAQVTVHGRPARVSGTSLPFAYLTDLQSGGSWEYAWETVERIVNNGGDFRP